MSTPNYSLYQGQTRWSVRAQDALSDAELRQRAIESAQRAYERNKLPVSVCRANRLMGRWTKEGWSQASGLSAKAVALRSRPVVFQDLSPLPRGWRWGLCIHCAQPLADHEVGTCYGCVREIRRGP